MPPTSHPFVLPRGTYLPEGKYHWLEVLEAMGGVSLRSLSPRGLDLCVQAA